MHQQREMLDSETIFALCDYCVNTQRGCQHFHAPKLVCSEFHNVSPKDINEIAHNLTGEFMQSHGKEAIAILSQMRRISQ